MAALIFLPFVAYAYLSPAVYRTTAVVRIKPINQSDVRMPPPLETARKLRDATLDDELIERLARDKSPASITEAQELRTEFELETVDGISFNVSFRGSDPVHTQAVCNHLARRVVQSASRALAAHAEDEGARSDRIDELMALLSAAPDAAAPTPSAVASAAQKEELARSGLRAERARLSEQLESAVPGSDNPYAAGETSPEVLKRRIAEIDRMLAARPKAAPQNSPAEVDAKFRELVAGLATTDDRTAAAAPTVSAELTAEAPLPTTPVEPKRRLVLLIGSLTALGAAGLVVIGRASARPRGRRSSRRAASQTHRITVATAQPPGERNVVPSVAQVFSAQEPEGSTTAPLDTHMPQEPKPAIVPHGVIDVGTAAAQAEPRGGSEIPSPPPPPPPTQVEPRPQPARQPYGPRRVTQVLGSQAHLLTSGDAWSYAQNAGQPGLQSPDAPAPDTVTAGSNYSEPAPAPAVQGSQPPAAAHGSGYPSGGYAGGGYTSSAPPRHAASPTPPREGDYSSSRPPPPTARLIPIDATARFRPSQNLVPNARRGLRDSLLPLLRQPGFVVGIVGSDEVGPAKAHVAAELALALASSAQFRLLLVECDFAAPSLTQLLRVDVPLFAGFSLQLQTRSREGAEDVGWSVLRCTGSLDLLGESGLRAPDALRGPTFEQCIGSICRNYDIVILNGPLLSQSEDCQAIGAVTDALVAVSRRDPQSVVQEVGQRVSSRVPIRVEPA
ncbi:MAG TPA: hypothetical protein VFQ35_09970 [Polyangiaceae bacterium]|nr:hypothetical protein [Polyangiaceae bacterium]